MVHTTDGSIFDDLGFESTEAENLKIRSRLMCALESYIKNNNLTQAEAAELMEVSQPRISDLIRGKLDKFTIDMLINMLSKVNIQVSVVINDQAA